MALNDRQRLGNRAMVGGPAALCPAHPLATLKHHCVLRGEKREWGSLRWHGDAWPPQVKNNDGEAVPLRRKLAWAEQARVDVVGVINFACRDPSEYSPNRSQRMPRWCRGISAKTLEQRFRKGRLRRSGLLPKRLRLPIRRRTIVWRSYSCQASASVRQRS